MITQLPREEFFSKWSQLHGGASISGATLWWLKISYFSARFFTALKVSPNSLTSAGLLAAVGMALTDLTWIALLLLVISLYFDGVDGSVAIIQNRASERGGVLDSISDRIAEGFWLYAAYRVGVPNWCALTLWAVASTQEYARARLASLGVKDIGVVTICERPVRAIFTAFIFIASLYSQSAALLIGIFYLLFALIAFIQVMNNARKVL